MEELQLNFYEVLVASQHYHKREPLTYASTESIAPGTLVIVELRKQRAPAVVLRKVTKPTFATKEFLRVDHGIVVPPALIKVYAWLADYYPAPGGSTTQLLLPSYLVQQSRNKPVAQAENSQHQRQLPATKLTAQQTNAVHSVDTGQDSSYLLHGDTGTGKTRVYLELTARYFARGQSVIVLTPEIGLTPQLTQSFEQVFGGNVITMHSGLTAAERRDRWRQVAAATQSVAVIGPRSALFSPVHKLGLVIIDEAHDSSYKQEQAPYYQATRVAARLVQLSQAKLVIGTATPPVADYYVFDQKKLPILRMTEIPGTSGSDKDIQLVNLRDKDEFSRSRIISNKLIDKIQHALNHQRQSLLFLNRRGTARLVLCQDCGWQALCPRCDLPLTFHADKHQLRCHTCGHTDSVPSSCRNCQSTEINFQSIGTKALVTELHKLFPDKAIVRFDGDVGGDEQLHQLYDDLHSGRVDIIVGTQMIAKGLDLPKLTVVGAVMADTSLSFPDYTADERTFQLLSQVCGRVGRGHGGGSVVIQSYNPDNPVLQAVVQNDYSTFYLQQVAERKEFEFPPFYHFLKLSCGRKTAAGASKAAGIMYEKLQQYRGVHVIGPSPAFTERSNDSYKWQLIVRSSTRNRLVEIINELPANWSYDIDPSNLL